MSAAPDPEPDEPRHDRDHLEEDLERGVEHLQAAAHEMVAAARSFLDVVEDVVSDREKLAETFTELLASAGGSLARVADRVSGSAGAGDGPDSAARPLRVRRIHVD